jgi:hypothetical protein
MGMNAFSDLRPFLGPFSYLNILPVCPEKVYPRTGRISFDIAGLGTNWNGYTGGLLDANSVPVAQLLFEGVRRSRGRQDRRALQPDQIEESYTYVISVPVNWFYWNNNLGANGVAATQVFTIPVTGWDFELMDILSIQPPFAGGGSTFAFFADMSEGGAGVLFTALVAGPGGNAISINIPVTTGAQALSITAVGNAITINRAANAGLNNPTTTNAQLVAAWGASPGAALVSTAVISNGAGGLPTTPGPRNLNGGT